MSDQHTPGPGTDELREMLRRGEVAQAEAIVDAALMRNADDASALYFRGVIANRRRDFSAATAALQRAVALQPAAPLAWLALGNAHAREQRFAQAADAYREVVSREPRWADAQFNLGLMQKRLDDPAGAARSLYRAWTCDPMMFDAAQQCMSTLAQVVRNGPIFAHPEPLLALPPNVPSVTVVICSIDDIKHDRVVALYRSHLAQVPHDIVSIRDARSLAEAYNRAAKASTADVVILSHDDVDILAPDFAARLMVALQTADVVGVVGSTQMRGPTVGWAGHPHLRGWVTHHAPGDKEWRVDVFDARPTATDMVLLDGVFLAARRAVLTSVPFDAVTFDGFHLYDVDWTWRVAQAGFRLAAVGALLLVHASRGNYGADWQRYADRFCNKYDAGRSPPSKSWFFEVTLDDAAQVRRMFALLAQLAAGGTPAP